MSDGTGALVSAIYEAAREPARWPAVTAHVARAFDASVAIWATIRVQAKGLEVHRATSFGMPRELCLAWGASNPWFAKAMKQSVGTLVQTDRLVQPDELPRDFLEEIVVPYSMQHGVGVPIMNFGGTFASYSMYRPESFDDGALRALAKLVPVFQKAALFDEYLCGTIEWVHVSGRAAILMARDGSVCFVNAAAERLLGFTRSLQLKDGRLIARDGVDQSAIDRLIHNAVQGVGGDMSIVLGGGDVLGMSATSIRHELTLPGAPAPAAVAIFLSDPLEKTRCAVEFMRQSYKLTPAETHVIEAILSGNGLRAASATLGIAPTTAKTHLQHIFQKTGTRHQAELVRLAFGASPAP